MYLHVYMLAKEIGGRVALFRERHVRMTNPSYDPRVLSPVKRAGSFIIPLFLSLSLFYFLFSTIFPLFLPEHPFSFFLLFFLLGPAPSSESNDGLLFESECDYDEWILQGATWMVGKLSKQY